MRTKIEDILAPLRLHVLVGCMIIIVIFLPQVLAKHTFEAEKEVVFFLYLPFVMFFVPIILNYSFKSGVFRNAISISYMIYFGYLIGFYRDNYNEMKFGDISYAEYISDFLFLFILLSLILGAIEFTNKRSRGMGKKRTLLIDAGVGSLIASKLGSSGGNQTAASLIFLESTTAYEGMIEERENSFNDSRAAEPEE